MESGQRTVSRSAVIDPLPDDDARAARHSGRQRCAKHVRIMPHRRFRAVSTSCRRKSLSADGKRRMNDLADWVQVAPPDEVDDSALFGSAFGAARAS